MPFKRLNDARRIVSKKVDLLCNDLISAYGELSTSTRRRSHAGRLPQATRARPTISSRCSATRWIGCFGRWVTPTSRIWLAGEDGEFQLGAYMKYTIAGDDATVETLQQGMLPLVVRDGFVHATGAELKEQLDKEAFRILQAQDVLGICCNYLGEPLAGITFFRDATSVFSENDEATLKAIAPFLPPL